ncbi:glycosyltransferase [Sphingomonas abietis]|uniref:Glycosyltransferase n=1 Tax=Sphingomonas abietis TaxID=3012344 RepID=A0ABY7NLK5_9SPHN|nr:hypothetical protein [Sphingomonas abietis]WBO22437.1 hypothetical protein PBT88_20255 [Sphingomonas abietis]
MKILYVSVHAVLEDDEVRLFKSLGHDVFTLGVNFGFEAIEPFRNSIVFNETERDFLTLFHDMGCRYHYGPQYAHETIITSDFVALFDIVVVMHDLEFINRFWSELSQRPVIWRTIGQNIDGIEPAAASLRARGMHVVRYSPMERRAVDYCGETALIRFCKNPDDYGPWTGHADHILTFCHTLVRRYPESAARYGEIVQGLPSMLGGAGNEGMQGHIGILSPQQQAVHYNACRAYLYCSGPEIPYTLNFMEALMTGMPVVAVDFAPAHIFYEIPALLAHGAGIVAKTVKEARAVLTTLLSDESYARSVSAKARARAIELFSTEHIGAQWNAVFQEMA